MTLEAKVDLILKKISMLESRQIGQGVDTCDAKEACAIIGVNNHRYLNYFIRQNLLSRRKGGKGFLYYKSELNQLAEALKKGQVILPTVKAIYQK